MGRKSANLPQFVTNFLPIYDQFNTHIWVFKDSTILERFVTYGFCVWVKTSNKGHFALNPTQPNRAFRLFLVKADVSAEICRYGKSRQSKPDSPHIGGFVKSSGFSTFVFSPVQAYNFFRIAIVVMANIRGVTAHVSATFYVVETWAVSVFWGC